MIAKKYLKKNSLELLKMNNQPLFNLDNIEPLESFDNIPAHIIEGLDYNRIYLNKKRLVKIDYYQLRKLGFGVIVFPANIITRDYIINPKLPGQKVYYKLHKKKVDKVPPFSKYVSTNEMDKKNMIFQYDSKEKRVRMIHEFAWRKYGIGRTLWKKV